MNPATTHSLRIFGRPAEGLVRADMPIRREKTYLYTHVRIYLYMYIYIYLYISLRAFLFYHLCLQTSLLDFLIQWRMRVLQQTPLAEKDRSLVYAFAVDVVFVRTLLVLVQPHTVRKKGEGRRHKHA